MTFIASVIAKKGVAIIADSLVTTSNRVIEYNKFLGYFKQKVSQNDINEIKIDPNEILQLFERKPTHTKDFEEKLFEYDDYTAITTAGSAIINKKRIATIINEIILKNKKDKGYKSKKIETKVKEFCQYINHEVIEHINKYDEISNTTFILTHFIKSKEETVIFKIEILPSSKNDITDKKNNCINYKRTEDIFRIVCDGQNRISERILFGEVDFFVYITPKIIEKAIKMLNIPQNSIPNDFLDKFMEDAKVILPNQFYDDMKIHKLADLSLQQAVDLAALLMKIEINFQKYTENIPTVGGVIKLAVIDKKGFRFISGNDIIKPENI